MAASLRGLYLRSWRYSTETEQLVSEALERERWSPEQWKLWQDEQLSHILHRAARQVPYYRDHWQARRRHGDRASWEYLENWPVLEKEPLRENPLAFVAEDSNISRMFPEHTSGTTGKPLRLWLNRRAVRAWYALFEARARRWNGVSRHDRWAVLGGQMVTAVKQRRPPFWVWNAALNQLYMSSYHLAPDLIPYYLDAIKRYRIKFIYAYSSSLYSLAQEALRLGRKDLRLAVAITNAEPLFDYQRETISEAFQCEVRETYGMSETVVTASECDYHALHLWPEVGAVEILEDNQPALAGTVGDVVCTGLLNPDMPLIRYRSGDRGALKRALETCACGRSLPMLASVDGRKDDVLYTSDGRQIGRLDPVFKTDLPLREAQIIQESLQKVTVRYVSAPGFDSESGRSIIRRLQERMGNIDVVLEPVDEIPRTANGKFRAVISRVNK
jgi:phenylacetate-CoA ligase